MRALSLNLFGRNADWPARRQALQEGLRRLRPDVLAIQEVVVDETGDQAAELLGPEYHLAHQSRGLVGDGRHHGASVASRWPILEVSEVGLHLTPRTGDYSCGTVVAEVAAPASLGRLLVVSHGPSWAWWAEAERELQALAAARRIEELVAGDPAHVVVGGDFNAAPDAASIRFWTGRQTWTASAPPTATAGRESAAATTAPPCGSPIAGGSSTDPSTASGPATTMASWPTWRSRGGRSAPGPDWRGSAGDGGGLELVEVGPVLDQGQDPVEGGCGRLAAGGAVHQADEHRPPGGDEGGDAEHPGGVDGPAVVVGQGGGGAAAGDQLLDLAGVDAGRGHRLGQDPGVVQVAALVVTGREQGEVDGAEPLRELVTDGQAPLEGQDAGAGFGAGLPDRCLALLQVDLGEGEGAELGLDRRPGLQRAHDHLRRVPGERAEVVVGDGEAAHQAATRSSRRARISGDRRAARASRSTWRARSRENPMTAPTSSRVRGVPESSPNRRISTWRSRSGRALRTCSRASRPTASTASSSGPTAESSSRKSCRAAPSSPIGVSRLVMAWAVSLSRWTFSVGMSSSTASSSSVGSRPSSSCMRVWVRRSRPTCSSTWTGRRMARAPRSAAPRAMAWRIHQVA